MNGRKNKLTAKQRLFIAEYGKDCNATQAAIRAGYSAKTAEQIGYQLLQKTWVSQAIEKEMQARLLKAGVQTDRVLIELARVGMSDIRKLFDENGQLKSPDQWDDDTAAAVAGLEVFEEFKGNRGQKKTAIGTTKKVRTYDKVRALDRLANLLDMDPARKISNPDDSPILDPIAKLLESIDGKTRGLPIDD
ncbi:MAG: terminase small subunit [Syntrophorhabdales bacterium]|jgi:phage terminase small subunit